MIFSMKLNPQKIKDKFELYINSLGLFINTTKSQIKYPRYSKNKVQIHPASQINKFTYIGLGTNINGPAFIGSCKDAPVYIGKYCAIAQNLRIRVRNHNYNYPNVQDRFQRKYNLPSLTALKGETVIGNSVWIGDNVLILPGVRIGDGAIIGAGSVVTREVPPFSVAVGVPARVIKKRFSEDVINLLLEIKWWDWPEEKIIRNSDFFSTDLNKESIKMIQSIINE